MVVRTDECERVHALPQRSVYLWGDVESPRLDGVLGVSEDPCRAVSAVRQATLNDIQDALHEHVDGIDVEEIGDYPIYALPLGVMHPASSALLMYDRRERNGRSYYGLASVPVSPIEEHLREARDLHRRVYDDPTDTDPLYSLLTQQAQQQAAAAEETTELARPSSLYIAYDQGWVGIFETVDAAYAAGGYDMLIREVRADATMCVADAVALLPRVPAATMEPVAHPVRLELITA